MDPRAWRSSSSSGETPISTTPSSIAVTVAVTSNVTNSFAEGLAFDFSNSNVRTSVTFEESLDYKKFMIRRDCSIIESPIVFEKNRVDDIFNKIGRKYKDIKHIKDISLEYSVPLSNQKRKTFFVYNDDDAEENLKIFYSQAEEMSPYPLIVHVRKLGARKDRPNEMLYKTLMKKKFSCDTKLYEMLVDNLDIAIKLKKNREFISVVMGRKCLNLLSPGHFYCHVRGCQKILILGGFCKLHIIERHWHEHQAQAFSPDAHHSCADLVLRYAFLKTIGGKLWYTDFFGTFEEKITQMQTMMYEGKKLAAVEGNFNYILNDTKFEGRPLLVDEVILESIINGDRDALSKIPQQVTMKSYFSQSSRRRDRNSVTYSRAMSRVQTSPAVTVSSKSDSPRVSASSSGSLVSTGSPSSFTRIVESSAKTPVTITPTTSGSKGKDKRVHKKNDAGKGGLKKKQVKPLKRLRPTAGSSDEH